MKNQPLPVPLHTLMLLCLATALLLATVSAQAQTYLVIDRVDVEVIDQQVWDSALGGLLGGGGVLAVAPDVKFCFESKSTPSTCSPTCENSRRCSLKTQRLAERDIKITVVDMDGRDYQSMATVVVADPTRCIKAPCTLASQSGSLKVQFSISRQQRYTGAFRGKLGGAQSTTAPKKNTTRRTPRTAATGKAPNLDKALADVRDVDNCTGSDQHFPAGTVFYKAWFYNLLGRNSRDTKDLYKVATFGNAIGDNAARNAFFVKARRRAEQKGTESMFDYIWKDVERSRDYDDIRRMAVKGFAALVIDRGLSKYIKNVPTVNDPNKLGGQFEAWIYRQLAAGAAADTAIDWLLGQKQITPECVYNELAKQGLSQMVK